MFLDVANTTDIHRGEQSLIPPQTLPSCWWCHEGHPAKVAAVF